MLLQLLHPFRHLKLRGVEEVEEVQLPHVLTPHPEFRSQDLSTLSNFLPSRIEFKLMEMMLLWLMAAWM